MYVRCTKDIPFGLKKIGLEITNRDSTNLWCSHSWNCGKYESLKIFDKTHNPETLSIVKPLAKLAYRYNLSKGDYWFQKWDLGQWHDSDTVFGILSRNSWWMALAPGQREVANTGNCNQHKFQASMLVVG